VRASVAYNGRSDLLNFEEAQIYILVLLYSGESYSPARTVIEREIEFAITSTAAGDGTVNRQCTT